jgi:hypothetical protein
MYPSLESRVANRSTAIMGTKTVHEEEAVLVPHPSISMYATVKFFYPFGNVPPSFLTGVSWLRGRKPGRVRDDPTF